MGPTLSTESSYTDHHDGQPKKIKKETFFIFDWDDTLMCTSFILSKAQPLSKDEKITLFNLGNLVSVFLSHCKEYGNVIILTNSAKNWVKQTALEKLGISDLEDNNIKIISTRDIYLKKGVDKKYWKEMALDEIFNKYKSKIENLICASDSERDINTFKKFMIKNKDINISTIKFKRKPNLLVLIKEIKFLINCLGKIIGSSKNYYLLKEEKETKSEELNFHFGNLFDYIFPN